MRIVRFGAGLAALVLSAQVSAAQQPGPPQPPGRPSGMMGGQGTAQHRQMMDSLNARLDTLVGRMNRATGNSRVTTMADVINELVAQRKTMHEHMRRMMESRQGMMMHMMPDSAAADTTGHAGHHPPN